LKKKKQIIKQILLILGIAGLLTSSIKIVITFYHAYFNNYKVIVYINKHNEAHIEAIVIPTFFIFGLYACYYIFKDLQIME